MRILVTATAMIALAAAPCAWDTDPREPTAIAALFRPARASDAFSMQAMPSPTASLGPAATAAIFNR